MSYQNNQNNQNQSNSPIDKGRVTVVVGSYKSSQVDQQGQPIMKKRYAPVGRATMWPPGEGKTQPNIEIELETMPMGIIGTVKLSIFWDSESQNNQNQAPAQQQSGYQTQQPQQNQNNYGR
jgi:hypothetical protein